MKSAILATAAALVGTVVADGVHFRRHDHKAFHNRRSDMEVDNDNGTCGCTTRTYTYTGEPTLVPIPTPSESVTTLFSTAYSTVTVVASPTEPPVVPTPVVNFPTPGTYTVPATTVTVIDETTVCGATSTELPTGTHTYGGVTTVVETDTTIVCPYATVKPTGDTVTSVIETTTYVCPSAGTYTIAPTTTSLSTSTVMVYPTPATYPPGTYTQDELTVTVTETDFTYVCPNPTGGPTSSATPIVTPTEEYTVSVPVPTATEVPTTPPVGGNGDKMGITYSPYTDDGQCKDALTVAADMVMIKLGGFDSVRIYSTDCDGLQNVGNACLINGLQMILGVFIDEGGIGAAQEQVSQITSWGNWDLVSLIVVGNEALFKGVADASSLASFIQSSAQTFKSAGYTGAITTTEPLNIWQQFGSSLCSVVDVLGANLHPFFNSAVTANQAGEFVKSQMELVGKICPGKEVVTLETGWPSAGNANGAAIPGSAEQSTAVQSIVDNVGGSSVLFAFTNELWKPAGEFNIEQSWGCINIFE